MATTIAWFVYRRSPGDRGWGVSSMVVARKYIEFVKKYPARIVVAHDILVSDLSRKIEQY
jgi:hypothetical protein